MVGPAHPASSLGPLRWLVAAATDAVVALFVCAFGWWRSATERNRLVNVSQADAGETLTSPNEQELSSDGATDLGGVQLWKDGPYWAECNVGASKPEEDIVGRKLTQLLKADVEANGADVLPPSVFQKKVFADHLTKAIGAMPDVQINRSRKVGT